MADPRRLKKKRKQPGHVPGPNISTLKPNVWFIGGSSKQLEIWSRPEPFVTSAFQVQTQSARKQVDPGDIVVVTNNAAPIPAWGRSAEMIVDVAWFQQCLAKKVILDLAPFRLPKEDISLSCGGPHGVALTSQSGCLQGGGTQSQPLGVDKHGGNFFHVAQSPTDEQPERETPCSFSSPCSSLATFPFLGSWAFGEALCGAILAAHPEAAQPRLAALTADKRSWVIHAEGFWPSSTAEAFEEQWSRRPLTRRSLGRDNFRSEGKLFAPEKHENRYSLCWGNDYKYSHGVAMADARPLAENPLAARFLARVEALTASAVATAEPPSAATTAAATNFGHGAEASRPRGEAGLGLYNGCYQNWYSAFERHGIAAHSDHQDPLVPGAPIFSLSWGGERVFRILPKRTGLSEGNLQHEVRSGLDLEVRDGDLVVMGGGLQQTHKHEVPAPVGACAAAGDRINYTARAFR